MDKMHGPFKKQIMALRQRRYTLTAAQIIIDNLNAKVTSGDLNWHELGISAEELEEILLKLEINSSAEK